jgi:hypothetical protein
MENLVAEDLGAALEARLSRKGVALACDLGPTVLRCDGFAVTRLLERLALDWSGDGASELTLTLAAEGAGRGGPEPRGSRRRGRTMPRWPRGSPHRCRRG